MELQDNGVREHPDFLKKHALNSDNFNKTKLQTCQNCQSFDVGLDKFNTTYVCYTCGRVAGPFFADLPHHSLINLRYPTYQRVFYFNERLARWSCQEPPIHVDMWNLIKNEASKEIYQPLGRPTRLKIRSILRSVNVPMKLQIKHRSQKFRRTLMSNKRFYDKHYEKWKLISWGLSKKKPPLPNPALVALFKNLFVACLISFERYRHDNDCDGRHKCDLYFDCWHNFINYDFVFRKLLQVAELKFHYGGVFDLFKNEFPLVSKKIRDKKLRPMWKKICSDHDWPCPTTED